MKMCLCNFYFNFAWNLGENYQWNFQLGKFKILLLNMQFARGHLATLKWSYVLSCGKRWALLSLVLLCRGKWTTKTFIIAILEVVLQNEKNSAWGYCFTTNIYNPSWSVLLFQWQFVMRVLIYNIMVVVFA